MSPRRDIDNLATGIEDFASVHFPGEAEAPILAQPIRESMRQWLVEINSADELAAVNLVPRRTALLSGPPGCGKTTLAHHLAARLGLQLWVVDMSTVMDSYLGLSEKNVARLFKIAEAHKDDGILMLDEFDSIARRRTKDNQAAARAVNAVVVTLLQKIDTFQGTLIAATNLGEDIDPAIWRRFGMHIAIKEPDAECRFAILSRYLAPFALNENALDDLTEMTVGATPALLRQLMEGVKRELVLAPRFNQAMDAVSVFRRILAVVQPHADLEQPPLWAEERHVERLKSIQWPPERPAS